MKLKLDENLPVRLVASLGAMGNDMDLVDALSSNTNARSVVELSLSPLFRRQYASVHDAIESLFVPTSQESCKEDREVLEMVFTHCLWITVFGKRRSELTLLQAWDTYRQRYDLEHFIRFGKQRLLMNAYQTPETQHEQKG